MWSSLIAIEVNLFTKFCSPVLKLNTQWQLPLSFLPRYRQSIDLSPLSTAVSFVSPLCPWPYCPMRWVRSLKGMPVTICCGDCTVCRQLLCFGIEFTSLITCCTIFLTNLEGMYLYFINALRYPILSFNSRMYLLTCDTCLSASQVASLISFLLRSFLRHSNTGLPITCFTSPSL